MTAKGRNTQLQKLQARQEKSSNSCKRTTLLRLFPCYDSFCVLSRSKNRIQWRRLQPLLEFALFRWKPVRVSLNYNASNLRSFLPCAQQNTLHNTVVERRCRHRGITVFPSN